MPNRARAEGTPWPNLATCDALISWGHHCEALSSVSLRPARSEPVGLAAQSPAVPVDGLGTTQGQGRDEPPPSCGTSGQQHWAGSARSAGEPEPGPMGPVCPRSSPGTAVRAESFFLRLWLMVKAVSQAWAGKNANPLKSSVITAGRVAAWSRAPAAGVGASG